MKRILQSKVLIVGGVLIAGAAAFAANSILPSSSVLIVRASGSLLDNVGPKFQLRVDGAVQGDVEVRTTSAQDYTFNLSSSVPKNAKIEVVFYNDAYGNGQDRNLYVDSINLDGRVIASNAAGVVYDRGAGAQAFDNIDVIRGRRDMLWNGALRFKLRAVSVPVPPTPTPVPPPTPGCTVLPTLNTISACPAGFSGNFTITQTFNSDPKVCAYNPPTDNKATSCLLVPPAPNPVGQRWSDPATWGGVLPKTGEKITIPAGQTIVLDGATPALAGLLIQGTLVADPNKDVAITSDWVIAYGASAKLQIGSLTQPYLRSAVITLTGQDPRENVLSLGLGNKVLGSSGGGQLHLFGETGRTAWTRLRATVPLGASVIEVRESNNWRVGDQIFVASTSFAPEDSERRAITAISGNRITLDRALSKEHLCVVNTIDGYTLDQCAEVGLLSRNIVVRGDATSSASGIGGHTIIGVGGKGYVSGVEFNSCGQSGILGRYCFHWHLVNDGTGQFIRDSSANNGFHKGIVVHGTNNATVSGNVVFDTLGHSVMAAEDGVEVRNTFSGNLAALARVVPVGKRVIPSDAVPANFWTQSPNNVFTNNVAAGAEHGFGFWFDLPKWPTGVFANCTTCPSPSGLQSYGDGTPYPADRTLWGMPFGEFSGNVAHSSSTHPRGGEAGSLSEVELGGGGGVRIGTYSAQSQSAVAVLRDTTSYWNGTMGFWLDTGGLHSLRNDFQQFRVIGAKAADNRQAVRTISGQFEDSLLAGLVTKRDFFWTESDTFGGYAHATFQYDHKTDFKNVTFANWTPYKSANGIQRGSGVFGMQDGRSQIDVPNFASGMKLINASIGGGMSSCRANDAAACERIRTYVTEFSDGSLLGTGQPEALVYNNPLLTTPDCRPTDNPVLYACAGGSRRYIRLNLNGVGNTELVREDGNRNNLSGPGTVRESIVLAQRLYRVNTTAWSRIDVRVGYDQSYGTWVMLALPYSNLVSVKGAQVVGSLDAVRNATNAAWFADVAAKVVYVKVKDQTIICAAGSCN